MPKEPHGPLEQTWRDAGLPIVTLPRLRQPRLVLRRDGPPCAFLPAEATGPSREVLFGWLIVELARRHGDWPPFAAPLGGRGRAAS